MDFIESFKFLFRRENIEMLSKAIELLKYCYGAVFIVQKLNKEWVYKFALYQDGDNITMLNNDNKEVVEPGSDGVGKPRSAEEAAKVTSLIGGGIMER